MQGAYAAQFAHRIRERATFTRESAPASPLGLTRSSHGAFRKCVWSVDSQHDIEERDFGWMAQQAVSAARSSHPLDNVRFHHLGERLVPEWLGNFGVSAYLFWGKPGEGLRLRDL